MPIQLNIKSPCAEDWNKMKPGKGFKFCKSCSKNVVDFTQMSNEEIASYFLLNTDNKTCGKFRKEQLNTSLSPVKIYFENGKEQTHSKTSLFRAIAVGTMLITGISASAIQSTTFDPTVPLIEQLSIAQNDTGKCKTLHGDSLLIEVPEEFEQGEPGITEEIILGKTMPVYEKMPQYPGGEKELFHYIGDKLKIRKDSTFENGFGTIYVQFTVTDKGKATNPTILRSFENANEAEQQIIQLINKMPLWIPGEVNGIKSGMKMILPIKILLK